MSQKHIQFVFFF